MNTVSFSDALTNDTVTANGSPAFKSTLNANVDFFSQVGAMKTWTEKQILDAFQKAFKEDQDIAIRTLLWSRDVREGAGIRKVMKTVLNNHDKIEGFSAAFLIAIIYSLPHTFGRFKDLLEFEPNSTQEKHAFIAYRTVLMQPQHPLIGLAAKYAPRKGFLAKRFARAMGYSDMRAYRKYVVSLTNVVEQKMCAKEWDQIEYDKVPSVAFSNYRNAFTKRDNDRFLNFVEQVNNGEKKINAGAVYPHEVVKNRSQSKDAVKAQWSQLPDLVPEGVNILPLSDVSGSMTGEPMGVSVALGLYLSERNKGPFKDVVCTFHSDPVFLKLTGDINERMDTLLRSDWGDSTNFNAAFTKMLDIAVNNKVRQEDMPTHFLVISDMQFDQSESGWGSRNSGKTNFEEVKQMFDDAGYKMPAMIFWNVAAYENKQPVTFNEQGVACVSGFSPNILKSVLSADLSNLTPEKMMLDTVMVDRYNLTSS